MMLAIPITIVRCAEWWVLEILTLMTGSIGVIEQASYVIMFNMSCVLYMPAMGMGDSANVMIGSSIGERNLIKAKKIYNLTSFTAAIALFLISIAL